MRRTLIPLAAALGVFAGAAALGFLVIARFLPERVRAITEGALGRLLQAPVRVEETQLYLHWGLALEARGLSAWPGPRGPALTVKRALLRVDLLPLLEGRVEPRWLRFEEPRLRVERDGGGAIVAPFAWAPSREEIERPDAPAYALGRERLLAALGAVLAVPLPAPRLEIAGGVLSVLDEAGAVPLEFREVAARVRRNADRSAGDFELRADLMRAETPSGQLRAWGELDPAGDTALRLELDRLDLAVLPAVLPALGRSARLAGRTSGELELRMEPGKPHRLDLDLHGQRLSAQLTRDGGPLRLVLPETHIEAALVLSDRHLELWSGRLQLGRTALRLEGALELPIRSDTRVRLVARASDLGFARLGDALTWLPPELHARAVAALERVGSGRLAELELRLATPLAHLAVQGGAERAALLRDLELRLRVEEADVWLGPANRLEDLSARVLFDGDRLDVRDAAATWNGVPLPRLDLQLTGVSQLSWSDDLRCQPPQAAPALPGRRALQDWLESRRDPEAVPWTHLELEADRILHPALGCMVEHLRAGLSPRADGFDFELEQATWAGAPLEGQGSFHSGPPERLALSLALGPAWEPVAPLEPAGPWATGRFQVTATAFGPWRIRGSEGGFELREGSLLLRETRLLLEPQGELHADLDLDLTHAEEVPFAARFRVENGSLADLARSLDRDGTLARGTLSAAGVLEGRLRAGESALARAVGSGVVMARDGELHRRLPPVLAIAMASGSVSPVADREVIPFDGIDAVLSLGQGRLRTESLALHGPWLRAIASGEVDVVQPPHATESVVALLFFRNLDKMIAKLPVLNRVLLGEDENLINAYFALSGPLGQPEARLIPVKTLAAGPASFVLEGFPAFVRGGLSRLLSVLSPGSSAGEQGAGERLGS